MLKVYCDASRKENTVAMAAIIVTTRTFIDYDLQIVKDIRNTTQAELRAVIMAFEMINRSFHTPQEVLVHSDSKVVIQQYTRILARTEDRIPAVAHYRDWIKLIRISEMHKVTPIHIRSHPGGRSFHTICDYAARTVL